MSKLKKIVEKDIRHDWLTSRYKFKLECGHEVSGSLSSSQNSKIHDLKYKKRMRCEECDKASE